MYHKRQACPERGAPYIRLWATWFHSAMYNVTDNGELLLSLGTGNKYIITEGE